MPSAVLGTCWFGSGGSFEAFRWVIGVRKQVMQIEPRSNVRYFCEIGSDLCLDRN